MTGSSTRRLAPVPLRPADTSGRFGSQEVIVYGTYEDGELAAVQLSGTDAPHTLVTGRSGSGVTTLLRNLAIGGARIGCDVRICDPKRIEMRGLRGWPGITRIETRVEGMIALIGGAYDEMLQRYQDLSDALVRQEDLQRILLIIDNSPLLGILIGDHWDQMRGDLPGQQPAEHPVIGKLRALSIMAREAKMNLLLGSARGEMLPTAIRSQFGSRIALGQLTREGALFLFGDAAAGRDIPLSAHGIGTAATPSGLKRVSAGWLPNPLDYPGGTGAAAEPWSLLLDMLPAGTAWDGPALELSGGTGEPAPGSPAA